MIGVTEWLREDLNLSIIESHLSPLIYHPRHGTLMRNLLMFLIKSTLSSEKYPTVLVREENEEIKQTLEDLKDKVLEAWLELEETAKEEEIHERELCRLKSELELLERTIQEQEANFANLESRVSTSNQAIERVAENIANPNYLKTNFVAQPSQPETDSSMTKNPLTVHQKSVVNELFCDNMRKVVTLHQLALKTIQLVEEEKNQSNKV